MEIKLNYISLFSGAGIGCFGFKIQDFDCIATTEILEKRLRIQKANNKCFLDSGYILGDITKPEISEKIFEEIKKSKKEVDVVIATPPCQGMSVVNQKKKNELKRNSLVVKAIELVYKINPKIFIFENVQKFLTTTCSGMDGELKPISEEIKNILDSSYLISSKIMNFKNYGANSSRKRTIVVGVRKDILNIITPFEIFPDWEEEKELKTVIGNFKSLKKMNEFDKENILHHFKKYDPRIIEWIKDLKQGESAFDNKDIKKIPHRIISNKVKYYSNIFGDKYKRQYWNKVAPCIHTANDCLASQNTIHPSDNRVFSIAELMELMTIPKNFKWDFIDPNIFFKKDLDKIKWLEKNQGNIRKVIGEAVPTRIFEKMAINIKNAFLKKDVYQDIKKFEIKNINKNINAAFYTDKINSAYIYNMLPDFNKKEINILEPSVGGGSLLIPLFKKYENLEKVNLFINDIDFESLEFIKKILIKLKVPKNFHIKFINMDYLNFEFKYKFDLIIGNPPFLKNINKKNNNYNNLFEAFWYKSLDNSNYSIFINPKYLLISNLYFELRNFLKNFVETIIDFGEMGFKGVKIETIAIKATKNFDKNVYINSLKRNVSLIQKRDYIFDDILNYWIIYRNKDFDDIFFKMKKNIFKIYKNYEISNSLLSKNKLENFVQVIRSKNINTKKLEIININNYDRWIDQKYIKKTKFYNLIKDKKNLFLIPNLTYYPRMIKMPKNAFVNGSVLVAELIDKKIKITNKDLNFYYSKEFRTFYSIAFNYSTRTLNIDQNTIIYFGVMR